MARTPDQIGKYSIVDQIGKGGMGMVYKAEHPTLDRLVILKKLNISGDPVMRERFRREAAIMIDFRTDYVVDVYDHFRHGSSDYIVLEYIDGVSLEEILARERYLPSDLALFIARDVFRGLEYVHGKGVVHRDVKPGNVVIARDGSVKLLDFGIASRGGEFQDELTREGMTLGTVAYIAPEQIERSRDVDRRADIYSAGATLYEMVTGAKAFSGGFNPETVNRIQRGRYRHPRRLNPRVSRPVVRVIRRCMRRKPRRRFQHAADVVGRLDALFRREDEARMRRRLSALAEGRPESVERPRRKHRSWMRPVVAGVLILLVAGALAWWTGEAQGLILGRTHALVRAEIRLRKTDRSVDEHLIRIELAREENGRFADVPLRLPLMRTVDALETPDYVVVRSRLLTMPAGRYRVTVAVEDSVDRKILTLDSVATAGETQVIAVRWDPVPPASFTLDLAVHDARTAAPVDEVKVEAWLNDEWRVLNRRGTGWETPARTDPARQLTADGALTADGEEIHPLRGIGSAYLSLARAVRFAPGDTVRLRLAHPDYHEEQVSLETDRLTRQVTVEVALLPRTEEER